MSGDHRHSTLRRAALGAWGMLTVVLVLCIVFLVVEMLQDGGRPFTLNESSPVPVRGTAPLGSGETRDVLLYFADPERLALAREQRRLPYSDSTVENCRRALQALIDGPRQTAAPALPGGLKLRGMYLLPEGTLVIDIAREFESSLAAGASTELLMVQSVANTLIQPALFGPDRSAPRTLRFLYEGSPASEGLAEHLDLSGDIVPDRSLLPSAAGAPLGD